MFENYTKDDIIEDLFNFTDALIDNGDLAEEEITTLAELRQHWLDLIREETWEE